MLVEIMLCGRYLVNFVLGDIYYNPNGRSAYLNASDMLAPSLNAEKTGCPALLNPVSQALIKTSEHQPRAYLGPRCTWV